MCGVVVDEVVDAVSEGGRGWRRGRGRCVIVVRGGIARAESWCKPKRLRHGVREIKKENCQTSQSTKMRQHEWVSEKLERINELENVLTCMHMI